MTQERAATRTYAAFEGMNLIGAGSIEDVALVAHGRVQAGEEALVQVFEDDTGQPIDLDLRGGADEVIARLDRHPMLERPLPPRRAGRGRPRLGVVSREVSLLPRHWKWLRDQPKSASATLRLLIEQRMKKTSHEDRTRKAVNVAYAVMSALAGNLPNFEEASRALFAHDFERFAVHTAGWPVDVHAYITRLLATRE